MAGNPHIIVNALSATGAGGISVARNIAVQLCAARPQWNFTLLLISGFAGHDQMLPADLPANLRAHRAPREVLSRWKRLRYERSLFPRLAEQGATAVLQLNGMPAPGSALPTFCHNQDPWPYRPVAWDRGWADRLLAMLRRRGHARGFERAATVGFTSHYLRDLMIQQLGRTPRRTGVYYNGLPESWIARASDPSTLRPLKDRRPEILSVSAVGPYKRQELVIRALPRVIARQGCGEVIYRIIGQVMNADYQRKLEALASESGVADRVIFAGHATAEQLSSALQSARCFVLMSVCESFGLPAIEAMSFGTPVVTSDCCAMPEVCGEAAVLSPVDDVGALAENLHRVLVDSALAERLRAAGVQNCQRFHWSDTCQKMAAELEQII